VHGTVTVYIREEERTQTERCTAIIHKIQRVQLRLSDMATAEVLRAEAAPLSYDQVPETKYERRRYLQCA
jgi:hypothetical protein